MERGSQAHKKCHGGPASERDVAQPVLSEEAMREAIFMRHTSDEDAVRLKMKLTFGARQKMVRDVDQSTQLLATFPRFADVKGLVSTLHYT